MDELKKCKNCQKVMTQQGEIWVCEDCGPEETVAAPVAPAVDQPVAPAEAPSAGPAQ